MLDSVIDFVFGKVLTFDEKVGEVKKEIRTAKRTVEREKDNMEMDREELGDEIKEEAASERPDQKALKQKALRYQRQRRQILKLGDTLGKLEGVEAMISEIKSNNQMTEAFSRLTTCMSTLNATASSQQICMMLSRFQKESQTMRDKQELIDEEIENAYGEGNSEDDEEEAENVLEEVFAELHIGLTSELPDAPHPSSREPVSEEGDMDTWLKETEERVGELDRGKKHLH